MFGSILFTHFLNLGKSKDKKIAPDIPNNKSNIIEIEELKYFTKPFVTSITTSFIDVKTPLPVTPIPKEFINFITKSNSVGTLLTKTLI